MEGNFGDLLINIWGSHRALDHRTSVSRVLCRRWTQWCWFAGSVPHPAECTYSRNARVAISSPAQLAHLGSQPLPCQPQSFHLSPEAALGFPRGPGADGTGDPHPLFRGSRAMRDNGHCLAPSWRTVGQGLSIKNWQLFLDLDASPAQADSASSCPLCRLEQSSSSPIAAPREDQTALLPGPQVQPSQGNRCELPALPGPALPLKGTVGH